MGLFENSAAAFPAGEPLPEFYRQSKDVSPSDRLVAELKARGIGEDQSEKLGDLATPELEQPEDLTE